MTNREIDYEIAEKIFGLKVVNGYTFERRQSFAPSENGVTLAVMRYEDVPVKVKPYSTSIADAWAVVEKMKENGKYVDISNESANYYCVTFSGSSEGNEYHGLISMAICKAALRSVGVEI